MTTAASETSAHAGNRATSNWIGRVAWVLAVLPVALAASLMLRYGVDLPRWDELGIGTLLQKWHSPQGLTFADLIAQSNESRLVFPKLICLGLAWLTNWDTRWPMLLTFGLMVANLHMLHRLYHQQRNAQAGPPSSPITSPLVFAGMAAVVCSPFQTEMVWGFIYLCHIPVFCLLAGITIANTRWHTAARHLLAICLCLVATFSYANGMICWVLLGIHYMLTRQFSGRRLLWALLWAAVAAGSLWLYWHDYRRPSHHPGFLAFHGHELKAAEAFASFFGAPLALHAGADPARTALHTAAAVGLTVVALWLLLLGRMVLRPMPGAISRAAPWLILFAYTVVSGLVTTLGRIGFGDSALLATRYAAFNTYLLAATLPLAALALHEMGTDRVGAKVARGFAIVLGLAFVAIWAACLPDQMQAIRDYHLSILGGRAALPFAEQMKPAPVVGSFFPTNTEFGRTSELRSRGYLRPGKVTPATYDAATDRRRAGFAESLTFTNGQGSMSGWAVLPKDGRPADVVVVTARRENSEVRTPVALAYPDLARPDVQEHLGDAGALCSGWSTSFAAPAGNVIEAWAVDGHNGKVYRLPLLPQTTQASTQP